LGGGRWGEGSRETSSLDHKSGRGTREEVSGPGKKQRRRRRAHQWEMPPTDASDQQVCGSSDGKKRRQYFVRDRRKVLGMRTCEKSCAYNRTDTNGLRRKKTG